MLGQNIRFGWRLTQWRRIRVGSSDNSCFLNRQACYRNRLHCAATKRAAAPRRLLRVSVTIFVTMCEILRVCNTKTVTARIRSTRFVSSTAVRIGSSRRLDVIYGKPNVFFRAKIEFLKNCMYYAYYRHLFVVERRRVNQFLRHFFFLDESGESIIRRKVGVIRTDCSQRQS